MGDSSNSSRAGTAGRVHYDFSGARTLVTGGTSGIGLAIARVLLEAGAEVTVTGTRQASSDYEADLQGCTYRQLDLADLEAVERLGQSFERLDVLVNNAGNTFSSEEFERAITVNLTAVHHLSRSCRPALQRSVLQCGGSIVNIASMMSFFGSPYFPGYGAAKAGIVQLTKTCAALWAGEGIRTNAIAAGSIKTRLTQTYCDDRSVHDLITAKTPLARWGRPEEIAAAALFLSSSGAGFITGHTLVVDGGYSIIDT